MLHLLTAPPGYSLTDKDILAWDEGSRDVHGRGHVRLYLIRATLTATAAAIPSRRPALSSQLVGRCWQTFPAVSACTESSTASPPARDLLAHGRYTKVARRLHMASQLPGSGSLMLVSSRSTVVRFTRWPHEAGNAPETRVPRVRSVFKSRMPAQARGSAPWMAV